MKRFIFIVILLIYNNFYLYSIDNYPTGARSLALSHASVSFSDVWSTFHNQAGLADVSRLSVGFYYESKFFVDELSFTAASLVLPTSSGSFGMSFSQFGSGSFKENKFGLAFSKSLSEKMSAGIQLDYFSQSFPENSRSRGFVTFEGGIIYSFTKNLILGAHFFNVFQGGIETLNGKQKMPARFRAGGCYQFEKYLAFVFEAEQETNHSFVVKSGIEFLPAENLALRFGVSGKPFHYTAGMGYTSGKVTTDIGFSYHGNLGVTPSISLQFEL